MRPRIGEQTIDILSHYAPNIRRAIIDWMALTPQDLEDRIGLTSGNIRHIDMVPGQMYADRPLPG